MVRSHIQPVWVVGVWPTVTVAGVPLGVRRWVPGCRVPAVAQWWVAGSRDYRAALAGNDLVVVGSAKDVPEVVAGTRHVRLRYASVRTVMPELLALFPAGVRDPWRAKRDVRPDQLGIEVSDQPARVSALVFVHVDDGYEALVDEPGDTTVHRLNLHENSLRYVRGSSTPWLLPDGRFGPYLPAFDDEGAHRARTATLERLLARSRYVAGPSAVVADHLSLLFTTGVPTVTEAGTGRTR